jgi:protein O-GlcNAc transferase
MLKKSPSQSELNNLILLLNSGNFSAAEASAKSLGKTYPKAVVVWKILGVAIAEQGNIAGAIDPMKKVVTLAPKDAEAHRNLATALKEIGQIKTAETHFRTSISLDSNDALSHISLAKILNEKDDFTNAEKLCLKAITLNYRMAEAHDQLGIALLGQKKITAAETSFRTAILLNPNMADTHNNLGIALNEQGKYDEADASYRQALALNPDFANAYNNMATNYYAQRKLLDAEALLLQAIALKPNFPDALNTLGNIYKDLNRIDESIAYFRKAITIEPAMNIAHSNLLLTAGYNAKLSQEEALDEARVFGINASAQVKNKYTKWNCKFPIDATSGKIKVGFVSGDFRKHAVAFFIEGLFRNFNKDKFELFAYPTQPQEDEITALLKPNFTKWQPIYGKNNEVAAAIIHQDAPHILFDLSGHTAGNRLPMFAYKPAPIQVTWLGYPATTGLSEMDYILGDPYLTPEGDDHFFVEKVWRLPEITWCFDPLFKEVPTAGLPALKNNFITFGCFNNLAKINDQVVKVWADILHALPTSKLYLQVKQLSESSVMQKTYDRFAAVGITADRLILEKGDSRENYFASFNKMDIALDPFPCPGGTTSADTLWMSVPVLTLKGRDLWSRIGETMANNVGLKNWIAKDQEDYINKAITFSSDLLALAELRSNLRQQVTSSPLFDAPRYTRHFETALTEMVKLLNNIK